MPKAVRNVPLAVTQSAAKMKQLELPFLTIIPWDGQYTFTHWIARKCFQEAAREARTLTDYVAVQVDTEAWISVTEILRKHGIDNTL